MITLKESKDAIKKPAVAAFVEDLQAPLPLTANTKNIKLRS